MKKWKVFCSIRRTDGDIEENEDYLMARDIYAALDAAGRLMDQIVEEEEDVTDVAIWVLEICPGTSDAAAVF